MTPRPANTGDPVESRRRGPLLRCRGPGHCCRGRVRPLRLGVERPVVQDDLRPHHDEDEHGDRTAAVRPVPGRDALVPPVVHVRCGVRGTHRRLHAQRAPGRLGSRDRSAPLHGSSRRRRDDKPEPDGAERVHEPSPRRPVPLPARSRRFTRRFDSADAGGRRAQHGVDPVRWISLRRRGVVRDRPIYRNRAAHRARVHRPEPRDSDGAREPRPGRGLSRRRAGGNHGAPAGNSGGGHSAGARVPRDLRTHRTTRGSRPGHGALRDHGHRGPGCHGLVHGAGHRAQRPGEAAG